MGCRYVCVYICTCGTCIYIAIMRRFGLLAFHNKSQRGAKPDETYQAFLAIHTFTYSTHASMDECSLPPRYDIGTSHIPHPASMCGIQRGRRFSAGQVDTTNLIPPKNRDGTAGKPHLIPPGAIFWEIGTSKTRRPGTWPPRNSCQKHRFTFWAES